jgi:hypothetical protein
MQILLAWMLAGAVAVNAPPDPAVRAHDTGFIDLGDVKEADVSWSWVGEPGHAYVRLAGGGIALEYVGRHADALHVVSRGVGTYYCFTRKSDPRHPCARVPSLTLETDTFTLASWGCEFGRPTEDRPHRIYPIALLGALYAAYRVWLARVFVSDSFNRQPGRARAVE